MAERSIPTSIRLKESELERLKAMRERLEGLYARKGAPVSLSLRETIIAALDRLEKHMDRLERDEGRVR